MPFRRAWQTGGALLAKSLRRMSSSKATTAAVSLNTDKLNYDGSLSFGALEEVVGGWAFLEKTKTKDITGQIAGGVLSRGDERAGDARGNDPLASQDGEVDLRGWDGWVIASLSLSPLSSESGGSPRADHLLPTRKATTTSIAKLRRRGGSRCVTSRSTPRTPWPRW